MTNNDFLLPDLGEGLTEAAIVNWLVAEGDHVDTDQPVVELESAKSVVELPTPYAGVVTRLYGAVGEVLLAGSPLLTIASADDAGPPTGPGTPATRRPDGTAAQTTPGDTTTVTAPDDAQLADPVAGAAVDAGSGAVLVGYGTTEPTRRRAAAGAARFGPARRTPGAASAATARAEPTSGAGSASGTGSTSLTDSSVAGTPAGRSPVVSPIVRRLAREHGFDAASLRGSGPNGLVRREDVEAEIAARDAVRSTAVANTSLESSSPRTAGSVGATGSAAPGRAGRDAVGTGGTVGDRFVPFSAVQAAAAAHFVRSRTTIPEVTIWLDVDATPLLDARARLAEATGERFGLTALVSRFALAGLRRFPALGASLDEARGGIVQHDEVNLGIAAQTARGLMVPVVHGASRMTTRELRDAIGELVVAAGEGVFPPERLRGGTFTVNNYGGFGVDGSTPIINHPEVAMLGIGRLVERPWVVAGELAVRRVLTLTLTFDHRVCDGQVASAFLTSVAANIGEPLSLLADV
ncbi:2-oxo acid dehydrogenase subunit E2 [Pseudoclavibacter chungangensis]|uniref:Dihydrolipoamide acetyltransferase component of pyruvate dehydrogenase complex n=1 Tax=Pseudoclavibacter chungangensis TaxID=587635 RepID=A0A7J5BSB1_9MICO|nr:dihydrolipoamide acetyltransferase family protein [Pseudoclavibacter chungangensis]KAB1655624.1 2-oxo acid dehydrogenase subunit E2 [Pseudoclavibacter chungangensis]NYJ67976.1 pyruvate dehydrogenase E2 component (dihydrolipoamide acetyltransferase) [Pseudoclavibacter chungangensis]